MTSIHVIRFCAKPPLSTCRMIQRDNKARRHRRTCVTNATFALWEPHALLCLGGFTHDCAYMLSTTSTPCAYLHTQSCLVSLSLKTSLLSETQRPELPFSRPHVRAISVDSAFPCPPHSDGEEEILGSPVYDVILWKGQNEICKLKSYPKTVPVHMQTLMWGQTFM